MRSDRVKRPCNGNYAGRVMGNMPHLANKSDLFPLIKGFSCGEFRYSVLDNGKYIRTHWLSLREAHGATVLQKYCTSSAGRPQCQACGCHGPAFSRQRILRPVRSALSKVRDAAQGPCRWHVCGRVGQAIRIFPRCLLSSNASLSEGWIARPSPQEARTETSAQMLFGSHAVDRRAEAGGPGMLLVTTGRQYSTTARYHYSPPQYRARYPGARKKGASSPKSPMNASPIPLWEARYEAVRSATIEAISDAWGCILIMRRGLTAWLHAWPIENQDRAEPCRPGSAEFSLPNSKYSGNDGIVHIVARMVVTSAVAGAL
jgi:hypothetical protein